MAGVLAEGTLYVNQLEAGVFLGRRQWPGVAQLEIKPNSDLVEATTKDKGKYGQISASVAIAKPADLSITVTEVTGQALAMALQGTYEALSQGAGTLTDAPLTVNKGLYYPLGVRNIVSSGFAVKNNSGSVTYVNGTDYTIDYASGQLYIIPTGAIADGSTIKVTCSYNAVSGVKVYGATKAQLRGEVFLDGVNLVDGRPIFITIHEALLTSDKAVDFMSDKPIELGLKGRMITPPGKSAPFEIEYDLSFS